MIPEGNWRRSEVEAMCWRQAGPLLVEVRPHTVCLSGVRVFTAFSLDAVDDVLARELGANGLRHLSGEVLALMRRLSAERN